MSTEQTPRYISVGSIKDHLASMHPELSPIQGSGMEVFNARHAAHTAAHNEVQPGGEPVHTHVRPQRPRTRTIR